MNTRVNIKRKNNSFFTAMLLLIILIVMWFITQGIGKSGFTEGLAGLLNADYENFLGLEQFSEERIEEVKKDISGFWIFSEGDEENDPVAKREYLEIIDNGIIWYVKQWFINDPAGGRNVITNVSHGYIRPYSYSQDSSVYLCETRTLRQVFIAQQDTCYGASQQDEMWQVNKNGDLLIVDKREYTPYSGELTEFFPHGISLDLVDKISLRNCFNTNLAFLAKKLLSDSFVALPASARTQSVESLINTYYKPIVFDELARRYDPRAVPDEISLQFTLRGDGTITDLRNRAPKLITKRFDDMAVSDMGGWLFPPAADEKNSQRVELTVKIR